MKAARVDAYVIPSTDTHLGEYVPDHLKIIRWLTGFTGSAANVVITKSFAGLWTDSRYFIQAEQENYTILIVEMMNLLYYNILYICISCWFSI